MHYLRLTVLTEFLIKHLAGLKAPQPLFIEGHQAQMGSKELVSWTDKYICTKVFQRGPVDWIRTMMVCPFVINFFMIIIAITTFGVEHNECSPVRGVVLWPTPIPSSAGWTRINWMLLGGWFYSLGWNLKLYRCYIERKIWYMPFL